MLTIPPIFDNTVASSFYDSVRALDLTNDVTLDGSQISRFSSLALQVLLSLEKSLQLSGKALHIANPSSDFQTMMKDVGLGDALQRWSA